MICDKLEISRRYYVPKKSGTIDDILRKDFSAIDDSPKSSRFHVPYNFNILGYNKESEEEDILVEIVEGVNRIVYDITFQP